MKFSKLYIILSLVLVFGAFWTFLLRDKSVTPKQYSVSPPVYSTILNTNLEDVNCLEGWRKTIRNCEFESTGPLNFKVDMTTLEVAEHLNWLIEFHGLEKVVGWIDSEGGGTKPVFLHDNVILVDILPSLSKISYFYSYRGVSGVMVVRFKDGAISRIYWEKIVK